MNAANQVMIVFPTPYAPIPRAHSRVLVTVVTPGTGSPRAQVRFFYILVLDLTGGIPRALRWGRRVDLSMFQCITVCEFIIG